MSFEKPVFHFPNGSNYLHGPERKWENVNPVHNTFRCSAPQIELQISPYLLPSSSQKGAFLQEYSTAVYGPEKKSHIYNLPPKMQLSNTVKKRKLSIRYHLRSLVGILNDSGVADTSLLAILCTGSFLTCLSTSLLPIAAPLFQLSQHTHFLCSLNSVLFFFFISCSAWVLWQGAVVDAFYFLYLSGYLFDSLESASLTMSGLMSPFIPTPFKDSTN